MRRRPVCRRVRRGQVGQGRCRRGKRVRCTERRGGTLNLGTFEPEDDDGSLAGVELEPEPVLEESGRDPADDHGLVWHGSPAGVSL